MKSKENLHGITSKDDRLRELEKLLQETQQQLQQTQQQIKKLTAERDYFEELLAQLPDHVFWKSRDGKYQGFNNKLAHTARLESRYDVIGKTAFEITEKQFAEKVHQIDEQVMSTGKEILLEEEWIDEQGQPAIYLSHKLPIFNAEKKVIGMLGVSRDITKQIELEKKLEKSQEKLRKEAEDRKNFISQMRQLQELISILPGNVYWKNREGKYLGCNENQAKSLGLASPQDIVGKTLYDLLDPKIAAEVAIRDEEIMMKDITVSENPGFIEESSLTLDRQPSYFLSKKVPMHNEKGEVIGLLGISIDITERKIMEEALKIAKSRAEEASKLKNDFIRNMEHDIRTPLSGVYGMSKLMHDQNMDEERKEFLGYIAESAKEILDFCDAILEFSKTEQGEFPVMPKKFDIYAMLKRIENIEMPAILFKKLNFILEINEDIPTMLIGDEFRLFRILINLVSNAVKFTQKGYVKLAVRIDKQIENDIILIFTIEDSGIGIPREKQAFIYEKFTRVNPTSHAVYKGLGLGLRVVKQFVEEMQGEIEIESEFNQGTCFSISLPFKLVRKS